MEEAPPEAISGLGLGWDLSQTAPTPRTPLTVLKVLNSYSRNNFFIGQDVVFYVLDLLVEKLFFVIHPSLLLSYCLAVA